MAQKDNELNVNTAEASFRISEASYRVAMATSKDSSSMFIISALTLLFLPPMFTSVCIWL